MANLDDPEAFAEMQDQFLQMGYELDQSGEHYVVDRPDTSTWHRLFRDANQLNRFKEQLERSTTWRLDLEFGLVRVDRETGTVEPDDGSEPFSLTHPLISAWSGNSPVGQGYRYAEDIYITMPGNEKPPLGGGWHKYV
jgi:hypothetical protein